MRLRESSRTGALAPRFVLMHVWALLSLAVPGAWAQEPAPPPLSPVAGDIKVAGQDVPVPARRKYVAPQYPVEAAIQGIRGIVILAVTIGEDGRVIDTEVTRSIPGLDEAARKAVMLWEYEVTRVAGKPVKVRLSQSITFALRLPDLLREVGVPELKSGGSPMAPAGLTEPESASVEVTLGEQGEVAEASVIDGNPRLSEALLRAVRSWRFSVRSGMPPASFTIRASWNPGPPPALVLRAVDLKSGESEVEPPASPLPADQGAPLPSLPGVPQEPPSVAPKGPPSGPPGPPEIAATPTPPAVETEVLPAREEPPAKEEGVSSLPDVILGENIPDLVKGRRPVWPPLARLGNVGGEVVVRFSVDLAGRVAVHSVVGPDLLKDAAEQAAATWMFRRTAIDRLNLIATFKYGDERAAARVERVQ